MLDDALRFDNFEPLILTISMFDNFALFVQSFFFCCDDCEAKATASVIS